MAIGETKTINLRFIKGYARYAVSDAGGVFVLKPSGWVKRRLSLKKTGYLEIALCSGGKYKYRLVHRLVAEAFVRNPGNKPHVNHKNCKKTDNRKENLEWVTNQENSSHAAALGRMPHSENHHSAKIKPEDVMEIRRLLSMQVSQRAIGRRFGLRQCTINEIAKGKIWRRV